MERVEIRVKRRVPDRLRCERYKKGPELGPKALFFSGGSALRDLASTIIGYTHNSIHVITPFDSGGSSAELRRAFSMPAVGDIRNRLVALADRGVRGNPGICNLFSYRLANKSPAPVLRRELESMISGTHPLMARICEPASGIIRHHLEIFVSAMPIEFDLRGASIGNLIITGGYLEYQRQLEPVIHLYSRLAEVRGMVRPVVGEDLHLAAELEDGSVIAGQHRITGKGCKPPDRPIRRVFLTRGLEDPVPVEDVHISEDLRELISGADLICFPMGSFFTSLTPNLLPRGVAEAVAEAHCPKVYVPSTFSDPETKGLSLMDQVRYIADLLSTPGKGKKVFDFLLMDLKKGRYEGELDQDWLDGHGVTVLDLPVAAPTAPHRIEPKALAEALLSLC